MLNNNTPANSRRHYSRIPEGFSEWRKMSWEARQPYRKNPDGNIEILREIYEEENSFYYPPVVHEARKYQRGENYDSELSLEEILSKVIKFTEMAHPDCKFYCTIYNGNHIKVVLAEAPHPTFYLKEIEKITPLEKSYPSHLESEYRKGYCSGAHLYLKDDKYNREEMFLTDYGKSVIASVDSFINSYKPPVCVCMMLTAGINCICQKSNRKDIHSCINIGEEDKPFRVVER